MVCCPAGRRARRNCARERLGREALRWPQRVRRAARGRMIDEPRHGRTAERIWTGDIASFQLLPLAAQQLSRGVDLRSPDLSSAALRPEAQVAPTARATPSAITMPNRKT